MWLFEHFGLPTPVPEAFMIIFQLHKIPTWPCFLCTEEQGLPSPEVSSLSNTVLIKTNRPGSPTDVRQDRANKVIATGKRGMAWILVEREREEPNNAVWQVFKPAGHAYIARKWLKRKTGCSYDVQIAASTPQKLSGFSREQGPPLLLWRCYPRGWILSGLRFHSSKRNRLRHSLSFVEMSILYVSLSFQVIIFLQLLQPSYHSCVLPTPAASPFAFCWQHFVQENVTWSVKLKQQL